MDEQTAVAELEGDPREAVQTIVASLAQLRARVARQDLDDAVTLLRAHADQTRFGRALALVLGALDAAGPVVRPEPRTPLEARERAGRVADRPR